MQHPQKPAVGRIVHYVLSKGEADAINKRRADLQSEPGQAGAEGHVAHVGNWADEGDKFPAVIVRVWEESTVTCNLQVLLDGTDTYWATSRPEGNERGTWHWPERV